MGLERTLDETQFDWFGVDGGSLGIYWPLGGGLATISPTPPAGAVTGLGTRVQLKSVCALGGGIVNFKIYAGNGSSNYFIDPAQQFAVGVGVTQEFNILLPGGFAFELLGVAGSGAIVTYRLL